MTEQRGYSEPVRDAADKPGLGGGLQDLCADTGWHPIGAHGQRGHQPHQAGGNGAMEREGAAGNVIGVGLGHGGTLSCAGGLLPWVLDVIL